MKSPVLPLDYEENIPWTLWAAKEPVDLLSSTNYPDAPAYEDAHATCFENPAPAPVQLQHDVVIQRPKYSAVLERMNNAKRKTSVFTSWNT